MRSICAVRVWLACCLFFVAGMAGCSINDSQPATAPAVTEQLRPSETCAASLESSLADIVLYSYDSAVETLLLSKNVSCITQYELARVDQLLSSAYLRLEDYDSALRHLSLAVDRYALDPELQQKSLYKAAQISYLLSKYDDALSYLQRYQQQVEILLPKERVLLARCYYAVERHDMALGIMIDLYARHRSGEIVMKEEWLNFLRGMQVDSGVSMG